MLRGWLIGCSMKSYPLICVPLQGPSKRTLCVRIPQKSHPSVQLTLAYVYPAEFSFGTSINAIDCWASGNQLAMVEKNDEMATWMPMVCHAIIRYMRTDSNPLFYHIAYQLSSSLRGMATSRTISLPLNGF